MAFINFQPNPKIPPIGFFQPITVNPKDWMTSTEYLLGILKKLNEVIAQTNQNTEFINNYSGKIEEIEQALINMQKELADFENEVTTEIQSEFVEIRNEVNALISTTLVQANAYTDTVKAQLEEEIEAIVAGQIEVFDPTTGILSPIQTVVNNLYNIARSDALTATEYDTLDDGEPLTATAYEAYALTAQQYDMSGKSLLV